MFQKYNKFYYQTRINDQILTYAMFINIFRISTNLVVKLDPIEAKILEI